MIKFYFTDKKLYPCGYSHAGDIKRTGFDYDVTIRGILYQEQGIIYLRINDFSYAYGLEGKRLQYAFNENLKTCISYIKKTYKQYKIYDSYSINRLPQELQKDILSS